ncbi:hypothetical protein [Salinarimonas ramus]|uniref:Uncharacterized protein n=1 Tax=Salinarimonas ramus TaxID=690164 RepID=A0A917VA10_9HYPH|nr:hypothetical protein [Salinarimonas ramus]GGK53790.1 hypothetical protein GCM10011322_45760 [Salinarimonas ramus]
MTVTIDAIFHAQKRLRAFQNWGIPERGTDYSWFDAALEIEGVADTGLVLHGGCYARRPNEHVTFELRLARAPGRQALPLERLDWRPLDGGHSNPRRPRSAWSGRRIHGTHLHAFELNWSETERRMRSGGLSTARDVDVFLGSFADVRTFVGSRLRIENIDVVAPPPWEYDLFSQGPTP